MVNNSRLVDIKVWLNLWTFDILTEFQPFFGHLFIIYINICILIKQMAENRNIMV